ncbi:MAG: hypothetical protein ABGZ35_13330 [Planctomycetaceae bacterium]|jgi:hypothetical protein
MISLRTHLMIAWFAFPVLADAQTTFRQPPQLRHAEYAIQPSIGTHCRPRRGAHFG